jgi:hypothetical protein
MPCPECGALAKRVSPEPARFYTQEPNRVTEPFYFLCETRECETVYFDLKRRRITRNELTVRVGAKEEQAPRLICYCFGHTEEAMEAEFRVHAKTTIPDRIRAEIAAGTCECEFRNPAGRCCLGEVAKTMNRLRRADGSPFT